ncbi:undecaprenyldiphospho-muramoylpentapeptide beta-N-acetylglucosaminyltransferase, partial [bacterium]|nr:undecaprenyldiphospho-muramoylpentapeptide beta-N-acetylglucosaminyltransferase [bacterium]
AAANHQEYNALALQQRQAAVVILESELNEVVLLQKIMTLVHDAEARSRIGQAIRGADFPHATDELAQAILRLREQKAEAR